MSVVTPSTPLAPFEAEVLAAYRGWDDFEGTHGKYPAIDLDLSPSTPRYPFSSRQEILEFFLEAEKCLDPVMQDFTFVQAKLRASITYLRALLGEELPFAAYLEKTMGITPKWVSEEDIEASACALGERLGRVGLRFLRQDRERFREVFVEHDRNKTRDEILKAWPAYQKRLRTLLSGIDAPAPKIEFISADQGWVNWFKASLEGGVTLQINTHPRISHLRGYGPTLAAHELGGHGTQAALWSAAIANGNMNPICGAATLHGPEQFAFEGVAQVMPYILGAADEVFAGISVRLTRHRKMISTNIALMVAERRPQEEIFAYANSRLPLTTEDSIRGDIKEQDPLVRCYGFVYEPSESALRPLADLEDGKRERLLKTLMGTALTATDVKGLVAHAISGV